MLEHGVLTNVGSPQLRLTSEPGPTRRSRLLEEVDDVVAREMRRRHPTEAWTDRVTCRENRLGFGGHSSVAMFFLWSLRDPKKTTGPLRPWMEELCMWMEELLAL